MRKHAKQSSFRKPNKFSLLKCQVSFCIVSQVKNQSSKPLYHLAFWTWDFKKHYKNKGNKIGEFSLSLLFSRVFRFWCIADSQQNGKFTVPPAHMNKTFKYKYSYLQILKWHAAAEYFVMQQFQDDYLMSCKLMGNFQGFCERIISLK